MEIIRSGDGIEKKNAHSYTAFQYPLQDKDMSIARIWINGFYPLKGIAVNHEVKELVYIEAGKGIATINGKRSEVGEGDVVFVDKGEVMCWEGELTLIIFFAPADLEVRSKKSSNEPKESVV